MKFGPVPVSDAVGDILAHSVHVRGKRLRKGAVLSASDVEAMISEGMETVIVAQLEAGDLPENEAASRLASAIVDPDADYLKITEAFT